MLACLHDIRSGISLNFNENKTEFIVYGPSVSKGIINLNLALYKTICGQTWVIFGPALKFDKQIC